MDMVKYIADSLNGRQYGDELTKELEEKAKQNGIVIVFGASDDLAEIRGAMHDEIGCYKGTTIYLNCEPSEDAMSKCKPIKAIWDRDNIPWQYETEIPRETFNILEDGDVYCIGIVFDLKNLEKKQNTYIANKEAIKALLETEIGHVDGEVFDQACENIKPSIGMGFIFSLQPPDLKNIESLVKAGFPQIENFEDYMNRLATEVDRLRR